MKNLLRIINFENGFTIIEILVVLVISLIIIGSIGNLINSSGNFFSIDNQRVEVQRELRFIINYIDESLKFAQETEVFSSKPSLSSGEYLIALENDYLITENFSGNSRRLSEVKLSKFNANSFTDSNKIELELNHEDGFMLFTNILLNNHISENDKSGSYIKFKK